MGKQKRSRQKPHKTNPTGLPSVKDFEEAEELVESEKDKTLQNMFDDVQSLNLEEKLSALQTLGSMSYDSSMAQQIAKDGVARIIGPLLVDCNAAIRANTASALKDIAKNGGESAYTDLLKDDIMTPLTALMKQYYSDWQPKGCKNKDIRDEKEAFIQAVGLLWTLCANNESAVKCANQEDLASFLTKFLDIDTYGIQITSISVQCLVCLSDENITAITEIKRNESVLLGLLDLKANDKNTTKVLSLKTSVAELLINISSPTDSNWTHVLSKVLTVLSAVLVIDHEQILSSLTSVLPHENNAATSEKKKKVQENRTILEAQEQALQILANLCFEDEDAIDSDSETMEMEPDCLDDDSMDDNLKITSTLPVELVEVINSCNIIDIIWKKSGSVVDKDSREILEQNTEGRAVLKQFYDIRCAAYLCLNNLLPSLDIDAFGGIDNLYRKWLDIGTIVFKERDKNPDNIQLLEAASAAMRAILEQLATVRANIFKVLTVSDIQPMLYAEPQCSNASIRVNIIRMFCNLVQILLNHEIAENYEIIKYVSTVLLDISTTETQAWVMAESIDALIDIFAEDATDQLAVDIKLIPRLQSLIPQFKSKVRQQKKSSGDGKSVISTVNTNLTRFIKYKEKRIRNLV
ncbi:hypothetical protein DMN91_003785 [Ooceraea biroi]|uniref:HEAT repeat-containing protein n=1 Tax=Ooceraea biroi TaxID=2015173 RepID=A0A026WZT8_OOCBI|nr:HEAT repeat-containing protein 3 [Ooceraea biroi]EZA61547.1 HEAT repeat-containing protein [Ooceraea biroi]RLU23580.1 hypothetical protein DMN91_003785 [Ooceraea biroi]